MIAVFVFLALIALAVGFIILREKFAFKAVNFSEPMPQISFISCNRIAPSLPSIELSNFEKKLLPVYRYCLNVINANLSETIDENIFKKMTRSDPYIIRVFYGLCSASKYSSSTFASTFKQIVKKYNLISNWGENGCKVQSTVVDPVTGALKTVYTNISEVPDYDFYNYISNGTILNFYLYLANKFINNTSLVFGSVATNGKYM
jgi:hypothetical protein